MPVMHSCDRRRKRLMSS